MFKPVSSHVDFPALERDILKFWADAKAFEKRVALNRGKKRWSFIDGPITANNPMGVHHAWGRTYKDLWHRYKAMQGFDIRYQNGFDCQGLWIEVEVEKELGFKSKRDIERHGIADFVRLCKERVLKYAAVQTQQSIRLGYWMDWNPPDWLAMLREKMAENPWQTITVAGPNGPVTDTVDGIVARLGMPELGGSYFTFSDENNYTIWAMLKKCHQRDWVYKGHDVMPWCPRCSTALSEHEIATEGYEELTHASVFLCFPLVNRPGESLLVWTTTPWTLTSNVAAAVHPLLPYVKVRQGDQVYWLAKGAIDNALRGPYEVLDEIAGQSMEGWAYLGPFDELPAQNGMKHRVVLWKDVGEAEGTGIVHIAPGCGKEDLELSKEYDLAVIAPLDEFGDFIAGFGWLTGRNVYEVAQPIFDDLKRKGILYRVEDYTHRYPVCWRCHSELVFRLVDEWFIAMDQLRHEIMDVTRQIRWIPDFGLERELDWLRHMDDWMISKKRFWGLALPIYECKQCGHFEVIGSKDELQERAVEGWDEFAGHSPHRPWIDAVKIACSKCGAKVNRIADVGNPWLDAGIVSYSTLCYNTDRAYWEKWFPADFITECFAGQFRNWFYSLLAMSTVMENRPPFLTVVGHALVRDEKGEEMHKSKGNAIEFIDAAETMGVDVMRWMYCYQRPEVNLNFGYGPANEVRRRFLIPLWNVYSFFVTYANIDKWTPTPALPRKRGRETTSVLDRWILSKLQALVQTVTARLDDYDSSNAARAVEAFVDDLSNWYVRRSRRRFWKSQHDEDKNAAYSTLYTCLVTLTKLLAPFIPFATEAMYQNLVCSVNANAPQSVHHNDWPVPDASLVDEEEADMDLAIRVAGLGRAARGSANIKLRQPLARAVVVPHDGKERERLERLADIVADEVNVKELAFASSADELVSYRINLLPSELGKKHGPRFPKLQAAVAQADQAALARKLLVGASVEIDVEGEPILLLPTEVEVRKSPKTNYAVAEELGLLVGVDTRMTPELEQEGVARELVRHIQELRKKADFRIDDRILTYWQGGPQVQAAVARFGDYIAAETLSVKLNEQTAPDGTFMATIDIEGEAVTLGVKRVGYG